MMLHIFCLSVHKIKKSCFSPKWIFGKTVFCVQTSEWVRVISVCWFVILDLQNHKQERICKYTYNLRETYWLWHVRAMGKCRKRNFTILSWRLLQHDMQVCVYIFCWINEYVEWCVNLRVCVQKNELQVECSSTLTIHKCTGKGKNCSTVLLPALCCKLMYHYVAYMHTWLYITLLQSNSYKFTNTLCHSFFKFLAHLPKSYFKYLSLSRTHTCTWGNL